MALAHHNSHMRKFSDLSRGWGIGEETFEFWSWLARQLVTSFVYPGFVLTHQIETVYLLSSLNKALVRLSRFQSTSQHLHHLLPR